MSWFRRLLQALLAIRLAFGQQPSEQDKADEPPHTHIEVWEPEQIVISEVGLDRKAAKASLIVGGTTTTLVQSVDHNCGLIASGGSVDGPDFQVRIREGSPLSFRRRKLYLPGISRLSREQRCGTRIRIQFDNVGVGVSIFVPVEVSLTSFLPGPGLSNARTAAAEPHPPLTMVTGLLRLVCDFNLVTATVKGLARARQDGKTAYATYEVMKSATDPNVTQAARIDVYVAFVPNTAQGLPGLGQTTVTTGFAPGPNVTVAEPPMPRNAFTINPVSCSLLFPFVSNQDGFDTQIAIANTSLDPFGTATQAGPVTLFYYGNTTGGEAAPATQKSQTIPPGSQLIFTLSNGGNFGIGAARGFQGYIILVANFQYCHAFAFLSDAGGQKPAQGYLAIQLDVPGLNRTGVYGETQGH